MTATSPAESEQTVSVILSDEVRDLSSWARVILLIKENQLATAAILFCAWQAGVFLQVATTMQGVCS